MKQGDAVREVPDMNGTCQHTNCRRARFDGDHLRADERRRKRIDSNVGADVDEQRLRINLKQSKDFAHVIRLPDDPAEQNRRRRPILLRTVRADGERPTVMSNDRTRKLIRRNVGGNLVDVDEIDDVVERSTEVARRQQSFQ